MLESANLWKKRKRKTEKYEDREIIDNEEIDILKETRFFPLLQPKPMYPKTLIQGKDNSFFFY